MPEYQSAKIPVSISTLGGGLNDGTMSLKDNETNDLQNIDFDKSGSIIKRLGYYHLNNSIIGT